MEQFETSNESDFVSVDEYEMSEGEQIDESTIRRHYKMLNHIYRKQALKESLSVIFWINFKSTIYDDDFVNQLPMDLKMEFFMKILKNLKKYTSLNSFQVKYFSLWNFSADCHEELLKTNDLTIDKDFIYSDDNIEMNNEDDTLAPLNVEKMKPKNLVYSFKLPPPVFQYFYLITTTDVEKQANIKLTDDEVRARIFKLSKSFDWDNALIMHGHVLEVKQISQHSEITDLSSNVSTSTAIGQPIKRRRQRKSSSTSRSDRSRRGKTHLFKDSSQKLIEFRKKLEMRKRGVHRKRQT